MIVFHAPRQRRMFSLNRDPGAVRAIVFAGPTVLGTSQSTRGSHPAIRQCKKVKAACEINIILTSLFVLFVVAKDSSLITTSMAKLMS